jgi:hypothetical protein
VVLRQRITSPTKEGGGERGGYEEWYSHGEDSPMKSMGQSEKALQV